MHRSRLCALLIDCSEETFDTNVNFWGEALGAQVRRPDDPADPYVSLHGSFTGLALGMQRIRDNSRLHLDIESDDVEAEVRRLEKLGATRVRPEQSWWIMRDPAGLLFCVVPPQSHDFPANTREWE